MEAGKTNPQPPEGAVREALERLKASSVFAAAGRMRQFIDFVVEKSLDGEAETLKEYRIGVEVFGRGANFDPRTDTIVRVEARRLRKKLQEYYEGEGRGETVRIALPSGSYAPTFQMRTETVAPGLKGRRLVLAGLAVLAVTVAGWGAWRLAGGRAAPRPPVESIAVLPFADLSAAKDQEHLCDGLTEELISVLSTIPALKVAARTSSFRFKGTAEDVRKVGAELGVEYLVEGSVRTEGKRLRVTAQLVRASDGYHSWSRQFDGEADEVFAIQESVAKAVAASVGAELGSLGSPRPSKPEAYRRYLAGRHFGRQFLPGSTRQAAVEFEAAIASDPKFAPAYAGLASSFMQMNTFGMAPAAELTAKARAAATRALELDQNSAEAHAQLGAISAFYDWDWKACEQSFRRAIEVQPSFVDAHWLFATTCLGPQGRLDEALREARRAEELDPLSPLAHTMTGAVHWYRKEFDRSLAAYDRALRLDPSYMQAELFRCFVQISRGRLDLAEASPEQGIFRAYIQARLGRREAAQAQIERMLAVRASPLALAAGYAGLGEEGKSVEWLERAAESKVPQLVWAGYQAAFEPLRGNARYRALRARMGLSD